jgi:3-isopropylmalate/(R)-2-methylmalate dehydratase small subunit
LEPVVKVGGRMAPLDRADVDTDQIIPKQFLKRIERTGYGPFLFFDWRQEPSFFLNQHEFDGASVLVAGANFGCGSSREHAPWAIRDAGFRAVIAPSFGDIFHANAFKTGIVAITLPESQVRHLIDLASEDPTSTIEIDVRAQQVRGEGFAYAFELDPFIKECLVDGLDEIGLVERHGAAISEFESRRMSWLPALK